MYLLTRDAGDCFIDIPVIGRHFLCGPALHAQARTRAAIKEGRHPNTTSRLKSCRFEHGHSQTSGRSCFLKKWPRVKLLKKWPQLRGQFAFLACRLIVVATAFLARDHAAVAPLDRSGHRPAVSPWANGHAAWADADGGV